MMLSGGCMATNETRFYEASKYYNRWQQDLKKQTNKQKKALFNFFIH